MSAKPKAIEFTMRAHFTVCAQYAAVKKIQNMDGIHSVREENGTFAAILTPDAAARDDYGRIGHAIAQNPAVLSVVIPPMDRPVPWHARYAP